MAEIKNSNDDLFNQDAYPTVFKKIDGADITIESFKAYKTWTVTSGSSTSSLLPLAAIYVEELPAIGTNLIYNDANNVNGKLQSSVYQSVNHLYYKHKTNPMASYGPTDLNRTTKYLYQSASVFSIPSIKIGEGVKPTSFQLVGTFGTLQSDRYGNVYDIAISTGSMPLYCKLYEGFNEYFDTSRIEYESAEVTYVPGIISQSVSFGLGAKFSGAGYIKTNVDGWYDRDNSYAISFWISSSNVLTDNTLILTKASSSITPQYPFRIELSGSNQIVFSAQGGTNSVSIASSTRVTGSWHHVVCQKVTSTGKLLLYVDGVLESSGSGTILTKPNTATTISSNINNNHPVFIGGYSTSSKNLSNVVLDEIRIYNSSLSTANITSLGSYSTCLQTNVVGNVFTKHGLAVISSPNSTYGNAINTYATASWKSTKTIYELSVLVKVDGGDFNISQNRSLLLDDLETYQSFATGSSFDPYVTTIGLYNSNLDLIAVGKLAQPIRKREDVDTNFLIRIDLDRYVVKG
jgi:hypothetical protein